MCKRECQQFLRNRGDESIELTARRSIGIHGCFTPSDVGRFTLSPSFSSFNLEFSCANRAFSSNSVCICSVTCSVARSSALVLASPIKLQGKETMKMGSCTDSVGPVPELDIPCLGFSITLVPCKQCNIPHMHCCMRARVYLTNEHWHLTWSLWPTHHLRCFLNGSGMGSSFVWS